MRWVLPILMVSACEKGPSTMDFHHRKVPGQPVATFAGEAITDAELKRRFAEMSPYQRARYQTLEQRKEYVDGLIRFELLTQEAVRRGLAQDPEVVETTKKVMVQRLLAQELDNKAFAVSEERIKAYYEQHKSDFVKPAMVRLAHVFFRLENRERADATLQEALKLDALDYAGFARLARERSEEPRTQPIEGDMRFLSDEELAEQFGPELVEAQQQLTQVGTVLARLVETPKGWHVLRLQGRQIALNATVEQVKAQIQLTLANEAKQDRYRELLERLKKQSDTRMDDNALGALDIDVKAAALEPSGPMPGFVPAPEPRRANP